jgi:uncharacterized protein (TIRG00374 family)
MIAESLAAVGWRFVLVFALHVAAVLPNTLAWRLMLPAEQRASVPFPALMGMLLAGDAVNNVTPSAVVGGEIVRISMLRRHVPTPTAAGASALAAMAQHVAQMLFVVAGSAVALQTAPEGPFRTVLAAVASVAALAAAIPILLARSRGTWHAVERRLDRTRWWNRLKRGREAGWTAFVDTMLGALERRPGDFALAVALYGAGWLVGAAEAWLVLRLLGAPIDVRQAFVIEALSLAIEALFFFVPAKMGTQEGGKFVVFRALGLDPAHGIALGLVRRLRELAWAAVGLALLGWMPRHARSEIEAAGSEEA